jgi:dipeptidyl aminopeptidase/acylaminoacyl peptidase
VVSASSPQNTVWHLSELVVESRADNSARLREQREDWLDTYKWILSGLSDAVGGKVDPSKVFVFGGSAGGTATLFLVSQVNST